MTEHRDSSDLEGLVNQYYARTYRQMHGTGRLAVANATLHRALERGMSGGHFPKTLEVGSGSFEHLPYVLHSYDDYVCMDLRVPSTSAVAELDRFPGVRFVQGDAARLELPDGFADRIIATCLVMHLPDPLTALREWQRVCSSTGRVDFVVSCDPGLMLRLFRKFVSERKMHQLNLTPRDHRLVNAFDHISSFHRILELARFSVEPNRRLEVRYSPFSFIKSFNANAFAVMSIVPDTPEQ